MTTTGNIPSARSYHGSAVIEDNLYIFGGDNMYTNVNNTLYSLNTFTSEWVTIPITSGTKPQPRSRMSMFSFDKNVYIFGGYDWDNYTTLKDFHEFSVKTQCWQELSKPP